MSEPHPYLPPMPGSAGELYRPSNGTEGGMFESRYCDDCIHHGTDEHTCYILNRMFIYDIEEPKYPKQVHFDEHGVVVCDRRETERKPARKRNRIRPVKDQGKLF